jgi:hypothetical protein
MTPQKQILAESNATVQKQVIYAQNAQADALYDVFSPSELENAKSIRAEFYTAQVQIPNSYDKTEAGASEAVFDHSNPVFKDFDMVKIYAPGEFGPTITECFVNDSHVFRWPERWKAYKSGRAANIDGHPITDLTSLSRQVITTLQSVGIFTIEQLARHVNPGALILNGISYQASAREFLSSKGETHAQKLEGEIAELKAQMAEFLAAAKAKATK